MQKTSALVLGAAVLFVIAASFANSQNPTLPAATKRFPWGVLREGQPVEIGGQGSLSYIRVYEDPELESQVRYRIKAIHPDGLDVAFKSTADDPHGDAELYLPLHAIHSVTVLKAKAK